MSELNRTLREAAKSIAAWGRRYGTYAPLEAALTKAANALEQAQRDCNSNAKLNSKYLERIEALEEDAVSTVLISKSEFDRYKVIDAMFGEMLALLDRIEIEEDSSLASQRHDIAEKHGLTVEFGEQTSGAIN